MATSTASTTQLQRSGSQSTQTQALTGAMGQKRKYITWSTLALMTVSSVASLRAAPTMAVFGLASVFLYILPAIVFFVPTSLVSAELASGWKGGVYNWVSQGITPPMGFLAVWCQFAQTVFYYPALLAYVGSTIAYVVNPSLASSGKFTAAIIIVLYWGSVAVSSRGVRLIAKLASRGTVIGTLIPGAFLVVMGIVYLAQGHSSAAPMTASHILPAWAGLASIVLIVNNFLAYAGMEMNAVHVDQLRNPAREFPKAIFVAMGLVLLIFILPALAISWVIPSSQISLTAGVMQAFSAFFGRFGLSFLVPLTAVAIVIAMLSGMVTWLAGPAKGLVLVGRQYGYLPPFFQKTNQEGMQINILVTQGIIISIIGLLYAFIPSVSTSYWIFSVMCTQVYLVMYVLMFIAGMRLRKLQPDKPRGYRAPMIRTECIVGVLASVLAFLIGFVPPSQFAHANPVLYAVLILAGLVLLGFLPPMLCLRFRKDSWKAEGDAEVAVAGDQAGDSGGQSGTTPITASATGGAEGTDTPSGRSRNER